MEVVGLGSILWVEDFEAMREFYSRVLGVTAVDGQDSEGWVQFFVGDGRFALHAIPPEYLTNSGEASEPTVRWDSPVKNVFYVRDLKDALVKIADHDVKRAPGGFPGENYIDFLDPEGNVFQISQADYD
ncbi:MAG: hypothetical protein CMD77_08205 [Gammaproteobacteria bacterium]|nr:hypothetical protein [Gammaproteobacteria bacterium]